MSSYFELQTLIKMSIDLCSTKKNINFAKIVVQTNYKFKRSYIKKYYNHVFFIFFISDKLL